MATAPPATSPSCGQQPLHHPGGPRKTFLAISAAWIAAARSISNPSIQGLSAFRRRRLDSALEITDEACFFSSGASSTATSISWHRCSPTEHFQVPFVDVADDNHHATLLRILDLTMLAPLFGTLPFQHNAERPHVRPANGLYLQAFANSSPAQ